MINNMSGVPGKPGTCINQKHEEYLACRIKLIRPHPRTQAASQLPDLHKCHIKIPTTHQPPKSLNSPYKKFGKGLRKRVNAVLCPPLGRC